MRISKEKIAFLVLPLVYFCYSCGDSISSTMDGVSKEELNNEISSLRSQIEVLKNEGATKEELSSEITFLRNQIDSLKKESILEGGDTGRMKFVRVSPPIGSSWFWPGDKPGQGIPYISPQFEFDDYKLIKPHKFRNNRADRERTEVRQLIYEATYLNEGADIVKTIRASVPMNSNSFKIGFRFPWQNINFKLKNPVVKLTLYWENMDGSVSVHHFWWGN